jgi:hypothetical protein
MKKRLLIPILILLVFALLLYGCKKKPPEEDPVPPLPPNDEEIEKMEDEDERASIMEAFSQLIEGNDPLQIKEFVDGNIAKLSQLEGNEMINGLERSLVDNLDEFTERLIALDVDSELIEIASDNQFFPQEKVNQIKNEVLKKEVTTLLDTNYKLINLEGSYYPIVDYAGLQEYNNYITDEWKEYLAIRAMDSNSPAFVDGSLVISYDDLANRIIKTENYLNRYLDSSRQEEMLDIYHNKITLYLKGVDNTPIADYTSKRIYDDVLNSYINTSHNEGYITATILYDYVKAIEENNRIIDAKILGLADELISEAINILSEYK